MFVNFKSKLAQVIQTELLLGIFLGTMLHVSPASAQSCSDFQRAVDATMTASNEVESQLKRFKSASQTPKADAGVCGAARRLMEHAATAVKLAKPNCDQKQIANDLNSMARSAESEVNLFCGHEANAPTPTPRKVIGGRRAASIEATHTKLRNEGKKRGCPNIVGVWNSWAAGLFGKDDTTFNSNGTAIHRSGIPGQWKCEEGQLELSWSGAPFETFTLSSNKLLNSNGAVGFSR